MTPPSMLRMAEKRKRQDEENNHSESPNHKRRRVVQNGGSYGATRDVYDHPSSPDGESSSPSRARSLSSSGKRRQRAKPTFSQSQSTSKGKGKEPEKPPPLMNRFFSRLFSSQPASSKAAPPNPFSSQPPLSNASSSKATSSQPSLSRASSSKVPPLQPSLSRASFSDAPPARASSSETSSSQASSSEASSSQASPSQPSLPNASTSQASPLEPLSVKVSPSKAASSQAPALKVPPSNPSSSRPPPTNVGASSSRTRIFTPEETERITVAVETYRDKHNMTQREVNDLIQKGLGVGRTVVDTELKKFWSLVTATCSGKPRQKVIDFCRMRFHNFKARGGHWTPEEEEQLAQLVAQGGTKWAKWSLVMNRHPRDLRDRYRNYIICGSNRASDRWAPEEEEMFKMHVHEALEALEREKAAKPDNSFYDRPLDQLIDWQEISRRLGRTRSRLQCMSKWKKLQRRAEST
ncbi:hypothetical protein SODALDRAFT_160680 [Sodiomyces alkalinus F11]|uniref:Myb-like DNA-binding domain-containing protein n=1 Tax=Sodiomyces alkalinus (strain CBS 110278 / VKM F-3762 / F11) TaxID=1314773 RepID=A0A3N2PV38_SODAK|nr:hypothetical protein SODALDRAFT_160680 [Sodiomyces alkalinus F11]ROT38359.1 hypothetical protein SODALDRAFT_160680 [Sodiomyces alkalinus F11]